MSPARPRKTSGTGRRSAPGGGADRGRKPPPATPAGGRGGAAGGRGRGPRAAAGGGRDSTARPPRTKLVPTRAAQTRIGVKRSQASGRTGAVRRDPGPGDPHPAKAGKRLGGDQVEGRQAVRELLIAGARKVHEIWLSSELLGASAPPDEGVADIVELAKANRVAVASVGRAKLDARAKSEAPQGVIAFAAPLEEVDLGDLLRGRRGRRPFLVAIDGVTDPGNLGAIIRNCEGAGVDGVLVPRHRAVHVTPTVAKASAGAIEYVPIALVGGLPAALVQLKERGVWIVGLDDAADRPLFDLGDLAADGICLVLGAEGAGLSRLVRERCDLVVSIPMLGRISSLNVAAAAALATYEVARHRA